VYASVLSSTPSRSTFEWCDFTTREEKTLLVSGFDRPSPTTPVNLYIGVVG
jgi:hypothetical protein